MNHRRALRGAALGAAEIAAERQHLLRVAIAAVAPADEAPANLGTQPALREARVHRFGRHRADGTGSPRALLADLEASRRRGFAIDDQENELGVNCIAIPIHLDGYATPTGAISISGVTFRCPLPRLVDAVPAIRDTIVRHLGPHALG